MLAALYYLFILCGVWAYFVKREAVKQQTKPRFAT